MLKERDNQIADAQNQRLGTEKFLTTSYKKPLVYSPSSISKSPIGLEPTSLVKEFNSALLIDFKELYGNLKITHDAILKDKQGLESACSQLRSDLSKLQEERTQKVADLEVENGQLKKQVEELVLKSASRLVDQKLMEELKSRVHTQEQIIGELTEAKNRLSLSVIRLETECEGQKKTMSE